MLHSGYAPGARSAAPQANPSSKQPYYTVFGGREYQYSRVDKMNAVLELVVVVNRNSFNNRHFAGRKEN